MSRWLPSFLRCFPGDDRFLVLPWYWHISGRLLKPLLNIAPFGLYTRDHKFTGGLLKPWWSWWIDRWGDAIRAASEARRQAENPDFV